MRRIAVPALMVVVVVLLAWAGVHNMRARRAAMQKAAEQQVTLTKANPGAEGPAVEDKFTGKPAPAFTLVDTTGKKVSLADFKGHPVIVNFWATWCGPCKLEMPWFEEFHTKYKDQGLVVLGISEDDGDPAPKADIIKAAQKAGVTYPILLTERSVSKAYGGVDYLPETFYVSKTGLVVLETAGTPTKDEMEANVRKTIGAM